MLHDKAQRVIILLRVVAMTPLALGWSGELLEAKT